MRFIHEINGDYWDTIYNDGRPILGGATPRMVAIGMYKLLILYQLSIRILSTDFMSRLLFWNGTNPSGNLFRGHYLDVDFMDAYRAPFSNNIRPLWTDSFNGNNNYRIVYLRRIREVSEL
jgi:hypothetical protein